MFHYRIIFFLILFLQVQNLNVFAEFYKYKDANGVLRFTDTLSEVPEEQREKVNKYKEYIAPTKTTQDEISSVKDLLNSYTANTLKNSEIQSKEKDQKSLQIQVLGNKISKIKAQLEKEYKELLEKKKKLEALDKKPGKKKSKAIAHLKEQAKLLNKNIQTYNQKKAAYLEAIKGYQGRIKALSLEKK